MPPSQEADFLPLPIWRLWGVGPKTRLALEHGVRTIGDLAALDPAALVRRSGRHSNDLTERARGIDRAPIGAGTEAKSVSHTRSPSTRDPEGSSGPCWLCRGSPGACARLA
jgi:DNA polymerase-4